MVKDPGKDADRDLVKKISPAIRAAIAAGTSAGIVVSLMLVGGDKDSVRVETSSSESPTEATTTVEPSSSTSSSTTSTTTATNATTATTREREQDTNTDERSSTTTTTAAPSAPSTTTTTALVAPPALTGVTVRPAHPYSHWTYSDAVSISWHSSTGQIEGVKISYGSRSVDADPCCNVLVTGLTPDTAYNFSVAAYNSAGQGPVVTVSARTFPETAPTLSSIVKLEAGSFRVTAPNLHSAFMYLVVPGIDDVEHPPIPVCSAYTQPGDDHVDCVFSDLDPGHWEVHSLRIVDRTGRSTTYFRDGRLQEYGLAAGDATTVAGPYRKSTLNFGALSFDV